LIKVHEVCKTIDGNKILYDINLSIQKGSIFGLIGSNGAGKSSLIKTIMGIWEPEKGYVSINGSNILKNPEVKEIIGFMPELSHYYESYKVRDLVRFYKLAYKKFDYERFKVLNKQFQIPESKRFGILSKGMRAKLGLMLNLSIAPELLILDEPMSGLDPVAKRRFIELILDEVAERKTTVIISSHNLNDIEQYCDCIAVINGGRVRFQGTIDEMKQKIHKFQVLFSNSIIGNVLNEKVILSIKNTGNVYHIVTESSFEELEKKLEDAGATYIEEIDLSLEDIYINLYGGEVTNVEIPE